MLMFFFRNNFFFGLFIKGFVYNYCVFFVEFYIFGFYIELLVIYIRNDFCFVEILIEYYLLSYFIVNLVGIVVVDCCV